MKKSFCEIEKCNEIVELKYVFKRVNNKKVQATKRADSICDGHIYLISKLEENYIENVDEIWSLEGNPINTYKVYLYSFQFLAYLNNGYEINSDLKYLHKGIEILESWIKFLKNEDKNYVYYDFAVANRVIIITEFLNICNRKKYEIDINLYNELISILDIDIEILYNDKNYRNDNHGLMMDRGLLQFASMFKGRDNYDLLINKAVERINAQFKMSFGSEFINVENSTEYHNLNYNLFKDINDFIHLNDLKIGISTFDLDKIYENHCIMIKHDKSYPLIGDSSKMYFNNDKSIQESKVFKETGLAIIKSEKSYLLCKSGLISKAHKHCDDNSFVYTYFNKDIFIDGGKYNYNNNDSMRQYITGAFSHNTINVNNKSYEIQYDKTGIKDYLIEEENSIVNLFNNSYEGVEFERSIISINTNLIFIINKLVSSKENIYSQVFNINNDFDLKKLNRNSIGLVNNNYIVDITEHNECEYIEFYNGYKGQNIIRGFSSEYFNEIKNINTCEFKYKCHNLNSDIGILVKNGCSEEIKHYEIINKDSKSIGIKVRYEDNEKKYYKIDYINLKIEEFIIPKIENKKNSVDIETIIDGNNDFKYAIYYILDDKIIHKEGYSEKRIFNFNYNMDGKVDVWVFIMLSNGDKLIEKFKL